MKKLFIVMGCFTAIVLMSSCTADSVVATSKQNLINPNKVSVPTTDVKAGIDAPIPIKN